MKIAIITFSPTGGTQKCADSLAQSIGATIQKIDLTNRDLSETAINDEAEIAIIAVPSYGGRMPSLAAERLKKIDGRNKKAVLLAVYGNRAFEDTLVELEDIAGTQHFNVVAAIAAIAQHCMDDKIATNRPDIADTTKLQEFGKQIAAKISTGVVAWPSIPGNRPYKKTGVGMQPATDKTCTNCGLCAKNCPVGAIFTTDPTRINTKKCLGCMRCVALCPVKAKHLPTAKRLLVHTFLSLAAGKRKEPQLFISI